MKHTSAEIKKIAEDYVKPHRHNFHLGEEEGFVNDIVAFAEHLQAISLMQPEWVAYAEIKLENGEYYHCGFQNQFLDDFVYQGIFKCNEGFYDEAGYPLRPIPSHYIHISQPPTK